MRGAAGHTAAWFLGVLVLTAPGIGSAAVIFQYETTLTAEPRLKRPAAVSVSPQDQSLCVTDAALSTLDVFDHQGVHRFRTDAISRLSSPADGSIDSRGGFVYVGRTDEATRTIKRLNFLGEPEVYDPEIPFEGWWPEHLLVSLDDHYVALDGNGLLTKHDWESGRLIWKLQLLPAVSEEAELLGRPVEAADGTIFVPDPRGRQILVVSGDGRLVTTFGRPGAKRGEFLFPMGVAAGLEGKILVLDQMRHRVLVFDSNHEFLAEFGRFGAAPGQIYHPLAIAAAPDGRVWIAQGFEGRVQVFRLVDTVATR